MFRINKDGYLEHTPNKNEEEKVKVEKHYHYYIQYPIYEHGYLGLPHIRWPRSPQYPTGKANWIVIPEIYTGTPTGGEDIWI